MSSRSGAHNAIDSGCPWMRRSICCQRAPECDVHCKLGSKEQWKSCCKNFNGPVVMRRHDHVHVAKSCVAPDCRTRPHPGQRPLWCHCPRFESSGHAALCPPCRSKTIPNSQSASETCRGNRILYKTEVRKSPASMQNSGFDGHTLNASGMRTEVGLAGRARLVQCHVLPEGVLGR